MKNQEEIERKCFNAIYAKHTNRFKEILQEEPYFNFKDYPYPNTTNTFLILAAIVNNVETVKFLIKYGVDVNVKNKEGYTALHFAADNCHFEIEQLLINAGADVDIKNQRHQYMKNQEEIKKKCYDAIYANDTNRFKEILQKDLDFNFKDFPYPITTDTLLIVGAKAGNFEAVEFLTGAGVDVNAKNNRGYTALHFAADTGQLKIVEFLINNGADVTIKPLSGCTALHMAAGRGHLEIVKFLINNGVDVNIKTAMGSTPLHMAAAKGQFEIVKFLINNGADVTIKNISGYTALYNADFNRHLEIVQELKNANAYIESKSIKQSNEDSSLIDYSRVKNSNSEEANQIKSNVSLGKRNADDSNSTDRENTSQKKAKRDDNEDSKLGNKGTKPNISSSLDHYKESGLIGVDSENNDLKGPGLIGADSLSE